MVSKYKKIELKQPNTSASSSKNNQGDENNKLKSEPRRANKRGTVHSMKEFKVKNYFIQQNELI